MSKPALILDFDGVIHSYENGWTGLTPEDPPTLGAREAIQQLRERFEVLVLSTRSTDPGGIQVIEEWLDKHDIQVDAVIDKKRKAKLMVDDRGYRFDGNWDTLLEFTKTSMEPWNR